MDIVDCDEGLGQVVAVADAFEPCNFGGEMSSGVEIPECALYAGKLIDVMDGLQRGWAGRVGVEKYEVGKHFGGGQDDAC